MKTPRFEELAARWREEVDVYIVFTREAHAGASGAERLGEAAERLIAMDKDGDNAVTLAEFEGPRAMFDPFDIDKDGVVRSHELLSARKIPQFADVEQPETLAERRALAERFREDVPGEIPVLLDAIDNRTSLAYGKLPNSLFVIAPDGRISHKFEWASEREAEVALRELLGREPAKVERVPIDWTPLAEELARAHGGGQRLLVQFTAPGCGACEVMKAETLADASVTRELGQVERAVLGVEEDAAWALFEALDLSATPAFVLLEASEGDAEVVARSQGVVDVEEFLSFLGAGAPERVTSVSPQ